MPGRTIASLLGTAWLFAGTASAADFTAVNTPASLCPLNGPVGQAVPLDPPGLMPVMRPVTPAASSTYYYQKNVLPVTAPTADPAPTEVLPVAFQASDAKLATPQAPAESLPSSAINTKPPRIGDIPAQSELQLQQQVVSEVEQAHQSEIFRTFPTSYYGEFPKVPIAPRDFQASVERVDPMYVCYERLYFEDRNSERYGWELGVLQPLVSAGKFYADLIFFPYNYGTRPCQRYEVDAGQCLPGDPVPYLIYPTELSLTGALLEAGTVVGLSEIIH